MKPMILFLSFCLLGVTNAIADDTDAEYPIVDSDYPLVCNPITCRGHVEYYAVGHFEPEAKVTVRYHLPAGSKVIILNHVYAVTLDGQGTFEVKPGLAGADEEGIYVDCQFHTAASGVWFGPGAHVDGYCYVPVLNGRGPRLPPHGHIGPAPIQPNSKGPPRG